MLSTSLLKLMYGKIWDDFTEFHYSPSFSEGDSRRYGKYINNTYLRELYAELRKRNEIDFLRSYPNPNNL